MTSREGHVFIIFLFLFFFSPHSLNAAQVQIPGATRFVPNVNSSGAFTTSLDIKIPPGINGLIPKISLDYNNHVGNGLIGRGWSLGGFSVIEHCEASIALDGYNGAVQMNNNDRYCLDGKRLIAINGTYGANGTEYRTEMDEFSRIKSYGSQGIYGDVTPEYFTVESRDGKIAYYGYAPQYLSTGQSMSEGRIESRSHNSQDYPVFKWAISHIEDKSGNYISFRYYEYVSSITTDRKVQYWPIRIDYVANKIVGPSPVNSISLEYEDRNDDIQSYVGGVSEITVKRLVAIKSYTGISLAREYKLAYEMGTNPISSRLKTVTECGELECFPPTTLAWSDINANFINSTKSISNNWSSGYAWKGDFNGDGLTDFASRSGSNIYVRLSTGTGFNVVIWSGAGTWGTADYTWVDDFNGDGKTDIASRNGSVVYMRISTGSGFVLSTWGAVGWGSGEYSWTGDFNGDGYADIVSYTPGSTSIYLHKSTGISFISTQWTISQPLGSSGYTWVGDFNGDGLSDIFSYDGTSVKTHHSNGSGFRNGQTSGNTQWGPPEYTWIGDFNGDGLTDIASYSGSGYQVFMRFGAGYGLGLTTWSAASGWGSAAYTWTGDFNSDGLTDIMSAAGPGSSTVYIYLSSGNNFSALIKSASSTWGPAEQTWAGDFNGDGRTDIVSANASTAYTHFTQGNNIPNLLMSIIDGLDAQISIEYLPLTNNSVYSQESASPIFPELPFNVAMYVVGALNVSDGLGGARSYAYTYNGARIHVQGRGFLGFNWIKVVDQGTPTGLTTQTFYRRDYPYIGIPDTVNIDLDGSGQVHLMQTANVYGKRVSGAVVFPFLASTTETTREISGALVKTVTTEYLDNSVHDSLPYDNYGNPEKVRVTTSDGHRAITAYTYNNDTTNWLLGQTTAIDVTSTLPDATSATRRTTFEYFPNLGYLKSETIEPNSSTLWLKKAYQYGAYGNRSQTTTTGPSIASRTSSITYGANGLFPQTLVNEMGHTENRVYDPKTGLMIQSTDPNNLVTTWQYNSLGQKIQETRYDGTATVWSIGVGNASNCAATTGNVAYYIKNQTDGTSAVTAYYDMHDREVQSCTSGLNNALIYKDTAYDALGRLYRTTRNYFGFSSKYWLTYSYDAIGRPLTETMDGLSGSITYSYNGLTAYVTDRRGYITARTNNDMGRLISVIDPAGNSNNYTYDHFGNLKTVTDAAGNVATMTYDIRGRMLSVNDPNLGLWQYQYDAIGNPTQQKDAKNQTITMQYDKLSRMTQRVEPEGTSVWTYDTATKGVGKLKKVSRASDGYDRTYSYGSLGRLINVATKISGTTYSLGTTYDAYGRLETITYPTGFGVRNVYDSATGILKNVTNSAGTFNYWTANSVNADGQVTWETFGNNVESLHTYDNSTGALEGLMTGGSGTVQYLQYDYDVNGNLVQRRDAAQNLTETFTYDSLNRVSSSSFSGYGTKTYQYSAVGNITSKTGVGNYSYGQGGAKPHAVTAVSGSLNTTFSYDANGNMTSGAGRTIVYTSFNIPKQITFGSNTSTFQYDPDHDRMIRTTQTRTIVYLNPRIDIGHHYEKEVVGSVTTHRHYIYAGADVVSIYTQRSAGGNDTRYLHKDHLGSIDTITNEIGGVVERLSYDVFGMRRQSNWLDAGGPLPSAVLYHGFTGHEHVDNVGLIHMNGRVYDPLLGRFTSADPTVNYIDSTQGLNRYSYADNNPLSRVDPSGYSWWSNAWKKVKGWFSSAWDHVEKGTKSAGRKVDKYKKEILLSAAAVYTGGATLAATGSYAAAGAMSGFVTGAYVGYQQDGFGGALLGGVFGGITGGLIGNGMEYYGSEWTAGRVIEESMVSGMSTELQGGDFRSGFDISGVTSLSRYFYNNFVAYDVEWGAGGDAVAKGRFTRPVQHANNIGEVTASINKNQWLTEGGRISRALNQVPGVNAVAGWHDVQQIFLDIDKLGMIRYVVNYPGMLPAAAITYSALLSGVPSTAIALSRLAERNNPLGEHSVWE